MKAVVYHGVGNISLDDVADPKIQAPNDAIVRITTSAICGTDLHMIRGTMPGMEEGTILGHEAVGVVEEVGNNVHNFRSGQRVVIASTIACGYCSYCRAGYYSQCANANPNGAQAGTCFFGGPKSTGPIDGLQAEFARVPFANIGLVPIPDDVPDEQAILLSDIFPTGWFGADMANIHPGKTIAVLGCGPVGMFAILSAFIKGAARVIAVDYVDPRLQMAKKLGAEAINFSSQDPVQVCKDLTGGIGVDCVIDAVGVDAVRPESGPAASNAEKFKDQFQQEIEQIATEGTAKDWQAANAPSMALRWAVQMVDKAGTISVIGVYPPQVNFFPFGMAMNKNLRINAGNCHHRRYIPHLLELVRAGSVHPEMIITKEEQMSSIIDAYKMFDQRKSGWMKVKVQVESMV